MYYLNTLCGGGGSVWSKKSLELRNRAEMQRRRCLMCDFLCTVSKEHNDDRREASKPIVASSSRNREFEMYDGLTVTPADNVCYSDFLIPFHTPTSLPSRI